MLQYYFDKLVITMFQLPILFYCINEAVHFGNYCTVEHGYNEFGSICTFAHFIRGFIKNFVIYILKLTIVLDSVH